MYLQHILSGEKWIIIYNWIVYTYNINNSYKN